MFGITLEQFEEMRDRQGGCCAMCGKTEEENGRQLAIDHDHACCPEQLQSCGECVRGLLCSECNIAVGYYEATEKMEACAEYVSRFKLTV